MNIYVAKIVTKEHGEQFRTITDPARLAEMMTAGQPDLVIVHKIDVEAHDVAEVLWKHHDRRGTVPGVVAAVEDAADDAITPPEVA